MLQQTIQICKIERQYAKEPKKKNKNNGFSCFDSMWDKLQPLQGWKLKLSERWLTNHISYDS